MILELLFKLWKIITFLISFQQFANNFRINLQINKNIPLKFLQIKMM